MDAITLFGLLVETFKSYSFCCCAETEKKSYFSKIIRKKTEQLPIQLQKSGPSMTSVGER